MQLKLSSDSPFFVGLSTRKYAEDRFYGLKNSNLHDKIKKPIAIIYNAFTGKNLDDDSVTVGFTVKNSIFNRLYGPAVYKQTKNGETFLAIKWGDEFIPLKITNQGTILPATPASWVEFPDEVNEDGHLMEFSAVFADDSPQGYAAICINVEIGVVDPTTQKLVDNHTLSIPIRFSEFDKDSKLTGVELKKLFRSDAEKAFELIALPNDNSNFVKLEDLAIGRIGVVGLTKFASKKVPGDYSIAIKLADGTQIWSPRALVTEIIHEPDNSEGWLTITENDSETKNVKGTLQIGKKTVPFAQDPPPQHSRFMGEGSHEIISYYMPPGNQYGSIVIVTKDGGRYYCPKGGNAYNLLQTNPVITKDQPAYFEITRIDKKGEGANSKYYVEASIILTNDEEELNLI